jgi:glucose/arabinose dehydrogenase
MNMCKPTFLVVMALVLCAPACANEPVRGNRATSLPPAFEGQFRAPWSDSDTALSTRTVADGLQVPWGVASLPDGSGLLVTERSGQLRYITFDGQVSPPIEGVPEVHARGQGGLLDVALGPDFATDRLVYLTYAKPLGGGMSVTAAARGTLSDDLGSLQDVTDIFVQSPPSPTAKHYGSRIVFDEQGYIYVTTGEHSAASERVLAQDLGTTYGKVIRLSPDSALPQDNPFVDRDGAMPETWSYGHRNIQGAAFDRNDVLWTIEHGPRGGDELNRPEAGGNYGWPVITYGVNYSGSSIGEGIAAAPAMEQPTYFWDPVIAPSGMSFHSGEAFSHWNDDLLIGGLVARALVRLDIGTDGSIIGEEHLLPGIGRVRDVEVLEDGTLVLLVEGSTGSVVHVTPGAP